MSYEVNYIGTSGDKWEACSEGRVLQAAKKYYEDVQLALDLIDEGIPMRTPFARYRKAECEGEGNG